MVQLLVRRNIIVLMKNCKKKSMIGAILVLIFGATAVIAQVNERSTIFYLQEGSKKKIIYLDKSQIAEIKKNYSGKIENITYRKATNSEESQALMQKHKSQLVKKSSSKGKATSRKEMIKRLKKNNGSKTPVFRMSNPLGEKISIPGNILVYFSKDMTDDKVRKWEKEKSMSRTEIVSTLFNVYEYRSGNGLYALEMTRLLLEEKDARVIKIKPVITYSYTLK